MLIGGKPFPTFMAFLTELEVLKAAGSKVAIEPVVLTFADRNLC